MIKKFQNFQNLLKNRPRFNIKYITMECPEFIVKLILGKHYKDLDNDIYFWEDHLREQLNLKH